MSRASEFNRQLRVEEKRTALEDAFIKIISLSDDDCRELSFRLSAHYENRPWVSRRRIVIDEVA